MAQEKKSVVKQPSSQSLTLPMPNLSSEASPQAPAQTSQQGKEKRLDKISKQLWGVVEQRRYIKFLKDKTVLFGLSAQEKRKRKVNVLMSKAIKSKTPSQCHSHHQKMVMKYGSIEAVIEILGSRLEPWVRNIGPAPQVAQLKVQHNQLETPLGYEVKLKYRQLQSQMKLEEDSNQIYIRYSPEQKDLIKIQAQ